MSRYVIVDTKASRILTVVEYNTPPPTPPPGFGDGVIAIVHAQAGQDWQWNGVELVAPPPQAAVLPPPLPSLLEERIAVLEQKNAGLRSLLVQKGVVSQVEVDALTEVAVAQKTASR